MANIRITEDQLQTPEVAELTKICSSILQTEGLDHKRIDALHEWLRSHQENPDIPAIGYLHHSLARFTADGANNEHSLATLKHSKTSILPEAADKHAHATGATRPEPWWTFTWMPTWGWWAFAGWAAMAFFMLVLTVVQSK